jgi:hypothetical protein
VADVYQLLADESEGLRKAASELVVWQLDRNGKSKKRWVLLVKCMRCWVKGKVATCLLCSVLGERSCCS